jgi:hypothetical protein
VTPLPLCSHDFWPLHPSTHRGYRPARHIVGVAWVCRCGELADTATAMRSESTAARWAAPMKEVTP